MCSDLMLHAYPAGILVGIVECQNQLKNSSCSSELEFAEAIDDAFYALISALYNFSRNEEMRSEIGTVPELK